MKFFTKDTGVTINISSEAIVRVLVLVFVGFLALRFFGTISHQLELIAIAAFLALALNPAVSWLSRRLRIKSRVWATGLAYIVVLGILIAFVVVVVPPFVKQTNTFLQNVPQTLQDLREGDTPPGRLIQRYSLQDEIDNISHEIGNRASDVPGAVFSAAGRVGGVFISVLTVIVLTFMMLVEGPLWLKRIHTLLPAHKQAPYKELAGKMYRVITGYVNGQVLIAAIAAFFAMVALLIASTLTDSSINIIAMGCIVFLFGLIPLIGNTLAAIVVVIISLFSSWPLAIVMAIYFPVYQQIENATLQPHIQAKNNQLTPLLVFVAALVGAGFGGLLGAFVAIPAAGCLRILLEYKFGNRLLPTEQKVEAAHTK